MIDDSFKDHVLDQLSAFFGIIYQGRLCLRTNEVTAAEFARRGMKPFRPNDRQTMNYHECPPEIFEDRALLVEWARCSIAIANKNHEE